MLAMLVSFPIFATSFHVPRQDGYVRDITGTLTPEQEQVLESFSQKLEAKTHAQVATLVVNNFDGDSVEDAAVKTFERWGIGQKGKDNGVLFIIAVQEKKMRIEVGYGLEGILPDGKTGAILDSSAVPLLKKGQIAAAIMATHKRIISVIDPSVVSAPAQPSRKHAVPLTAVQQFVLQNLFILFIVLFIGLLFVSPTLRAFVLLLLFSGRWGGGGSSGGGFNSGGGFGGFGGGQSGGGGASRDW